MLQVVEMILWEKFLLGMVVYTILDLELLCVLILKHVLPCFVTSISYLGFETAEKPVHFL